MALLRLRWRDFSKGWWPMGPRDAAPEGTLRRATGISALPRQSARSRWGASLAQALAAHSIHRFDDVRYYGVGGDFFRVGTKINEGLRDNQRLAFVIAAPTDGTENYLFVTGGSGLFKVRSTGTTSRWGIVAPPNGFRASRETASSKVIDVFDTTLTWTATNATLEVEGTIRQEGTASMAMEVNANTVATATRTITGTSQNLTEFTGGAKAPEQDFIAVWVRVDNPKNLDRLQLHFSLGDTTFNSNFFVRTIDVRADQFGSTSLVQEVIGIKKGQIFSNVERWVDGKGEGAEDWQPSQAARTRHFISTNISQLAIPQSVNVWTRLRIAKLLFERAGSGDFWWDDVSAVRLAVQTNTAGPVTVYWDDLRLVGGAGLAGEYRYHVTFLNTLTGTRSNPNADSVLVEAVTRQSITLTSLPVSSDGQVDAREIWRTVGGGKRFFRAFTIKDNTTTTFTDRTADLAGMDDATTLVLEPLELPRDNHSPEHTLDDAFGPSAGRMFWCRDSETGRKGRVYYSPVGRMEAVEGWINVSTDGDPTQKGVVWNSVPYVFTEQRIFRILGTDPPFVPNEVAGAPGTIRPFAVKTSPYGILYHAHDGPRLFNGLRSILVGDAAVGALFRGEALEGIAAFEPEIAEYGRSEYLLSDGVTTLGFRPADAAWRNLGLATTALFYEADTDRFLATVGANVLAIEDEGASADNDASIPFEIEPPAVRVDEDHSGVLQRVYIDINTSNQFVTPILVLDNDTRALENIRTASRQLIERPVGTTTWVVGVRLRGDVKAPVEVFGLGADVYVPGEPPPAAVQRVRVEPEGTP